MTKKSSHFNGINRICIIKAPTCFSALARISPCDMLNPNALINTPQTLPGLSMATGKQGGIVGTGLFNG